MSNSITMESKRHPSVRIKVFGVGGAGNNAINRMASDSRADLEGVTLVAVNTDVQDLEICNANEKIAIGEKTTRGFGAGADPAVGKAAAEESTELLKQSLEDADMVVITPGMGGGTGTGAAPVIAALAKEMGKLTVAFVTKPFSFEPSRRMKVAKEGIANLKENVDSFAVILNQNLIDQPKLTDGKLGLGQAFELADSVLDHALRSIVYIITHNSYMNVDFRDMESVLKNGGVLHVAVGRASGENMLMEAAKNSASSPLLETPLAGGASKVIIHFTCPSTVSLTDFSDACEYIKTYASAGAELDGIPGLTLDDSSDEACCTIIASGLTEDGEASRPNLNRFADDATAEERTADADSKEDDPEFFEFGEYKKVFNRPMPPKSHE